MLLQADLRCFEVFLTAISVIIRACIAEKAKKQPQSLAHQSPARREKPQVYLKIVEGSPSGLWRSPGTRVYSKGYRGFESLSLRQINMAYC
jgi:hypothetical protein